jgi:diacylglycerol kinase family enzyme
VVILINPKAGSKDSRPWAEQLANRLKSEGFQAELFTDLAAAAAQANQWHAEGCLRAFVGAGGDGTAAELVNRTVEGVTLAVLPTGNSNLLARYFHFHRNPELLCQTLVEGVTTRIDAGLANGRIFLLMAGCGFDGEVVRRVHGQRAGHIHSTSYLKPVAEAAWQYPFPEIQIDCEEADGTSRHLSARWLFVFNLPCYGGGFRIAPHADGFDGLLDICSFRRGGRWSGIQYVSAIRLGLHQHLADWTTCRARRIRITSNEQVPYQLDGDPGGLLPLDIQSLPGRLTLLMPREALEKKQQ